MIEKITIDRNGRLGASGRARRRWLIRRCISSILVVWWVAAWRWPRLRYHGWCRRQMMNR